MALLRGLTWVGIALMPTVALAGEPGAMPKDGGESRWRPGQFADMRDTLDVNGPLVLLDIQSVRDELALGAGQIPALRDLEKAHGKAVWDAVDRRPEPAGPPSLSRTVIVPEIAEFRRAWYAEARKILSADQYRRLWEIALQVNGLAAVTWPEIQEELNMSPGQIAYVTAIEAKLTEAKKRRKDEVFRKLQGYYMGKGREFAQEVSDPDRRRAAFQDWLDEQTPNIDRLYEETERSRTEAARAIAGQLTRRQKERFVRMQGEPFPDADLLRHPGVWQEKVGRTPR